jgi:hypothetical protein
MAVFTAIPFFVFLMTTLYAQGLIGRPSSTAGIGYVFAPVFAGIVAIVFFIVGYSVRSWVARTYPGPTIMTWRAMSILAAVFVLVVVAAGVLGWDVTAIHEATHPPNVTVQR